jgi:hypothetical protein
MGDCIGVTDEKAPAIEAGRLVAYYKNGWRYGRILATTAKLAHIKPAGCGAALWVELACVVEAQ